MTSAEKENSGALEGPVLEKIWLHSRQAKNLHLAGLAATEVAINMRRHTDATYSLRTDDM